MTPDEEHSLLMREVSKIAKALAQTLSPLCEVVLHDLTRPDCAITQIENNLSGRKVGGPATELGLARISDPNFPDILVNYPNKFVDGRSVKSTSVGLRDSEGRYIAALCLNIDISYLSSISAYIDGIIRTQKPDETVKENLEAPGTGAIEEIVRTFAASRNKEPRALNVEERRTIIAQLSQNGYLELRGAVDQIAKMIGASRGSVYYYRQER